MDVASQIVAVYELADSPSMNGSLLGTAWPIAIDGFQGTVHLPGEPSDDWGAARPPDGLPLDRLQFDGSWGHVWGPGRRSDGLHDLWSMHAVCMTFPLPEDLGPDGMREVGHRLYDNANGWQDRLFAWLGALCGQDLSPVHPSRQTRQDAEGLSMIGYDTGGQAHRLGRLLVKARVGSEEEVCTDSNWRTAVAKASAGETLTTEWTLLTAANLALRRQRTREAVVEAAATVEYSLNQAISSLPSLTPEVVTLLTERATLGRLVQIGRKLGVPVPAGADVLVALRNKVIHHAHTPGVEEAAEAVKHVRRMLEQGPGP